MGIASCSLAQAHARASSALRCCAASKRAFVLHTGEGISTSLSVCLSAAAAAALEGVRRQLDVRAHCRHVLESLRRAVALQLARVDVPLQRARARRHLLQRPLHRALALLATRALLAPGALRAHANTITGHSCPASLDSTVGRNADVHCKKH
eukprot:6177739-Pleurochrysis_carterae.AAC.4